MINQFNIPRNIVENNTSPITSCYKQTLDIRNLLELLHINNDINVQIRLFSTLSACLMSHVGDIDEIITYNAIYDKISYLISNCTVKKATIIFNFISALIYSTDEDTSRRKTLNVYAKNMIRSSGCLATMCELFTSCMMHQDAWRSLCQCLAETCRGVEANQSYCTHLIPVCIQRCSQRNIEVFLVLQSLLQNHQRNVNLFIECNGISLFEREFLHHGTSLQLLSTLVESSTQAVQLIAGTKVCQTLRDFLCSYGPDSQLGQWATVILYYITGPEGFRENQKSFESKPSNRIISGPTLPELHRTTNTTLFLQKVMDEIIHSAPPAELRYIQERTNHGINKDLYPNQSLKNKVIVDRYMQKETDNDINKVLLRNQSTRNKHLMDTYMQDGKNSGMNEDLLHNQSISNKGVMDRYMQERTNNGMNIHLLHNQSSNKHIVNKYMQERTNNGFKNDLFHSQSIKNKMLTSQQNVASQCNFTNLENIVSSHGRRNCNYDAPMPNITMKNALSVNIPEKCPKTFAANNMSNTESSFDICASYLKQNCNRQQSPDLSDFRPKFASTPLKSNSSKLYRSKTINVQNSRTNIRYNSIEKPKIKRKAKRTEIFQSSVIKSTRIDQSMTDKDNKHRSISGWFFETINESCTAFVKTVKNIFRPKIISENAKEKCSKPASNEPSCSYSFTNYMKERDAILSTECTKKFKSACEDFSMDMGHGCNTCNDTLELKKKMANDEHLKQTVRKLKLGINLYGCDFKKISKQLWPKQTYMTPTVLYNLYRKLIIK